MRQAIGKLLGECDNRHTHGQRCSRLLFQIVLTELSEHLSQIEGDGIGKRKKCKFPWVCLHPYKIIVFMLVRQC